MQRPSQTIMRGAIAGLVGAAALAIWFLLIDAVRGELFATPTFVASALLGLNGARPTLTLLIAYTAVHFLVFMAIGAAVAWALDRAHLPAYMALGLVLGFLLFDLIFYAGVIVTGANVVDALGWPQVLVGNLIAALALMGYLNVTGPEKTVRLRDILRDHRTTREGLIAGAAGAVAVMIWFLVLDLVRGQLLFTPSALGSAVFYGARGVAEVQTNAATVVGYTLIHIGAFISAGLLMSALTEAARRNPPLLLGLVLFFVTFEVLFIGLIAIIATWLLDAMDWWTIVIANLIAAGIMGGYLLHEHPEVTENLSHDLEEELVSTE
jgi:hypothetical protein